MNESQQPSRIEKLEIFCRKQVLLLRKKTWQQHEVSYPFVFKVFVNQAATEEEEEEQDTHL